MASTGSLVATLENINVQALGELTDPAPDPDTNTGSLDLTLDNITIDSLASETPFGFAAITLELPNIRAIAQGSTPDFRAAYLLGQSSEVRLFGRATDLTARPPLVAPSETFETAINYGTSVDFARLFVVALHGRAGRIDRIVTAVRNGSPGDVAIYAPTPPSGEGPWWGSGFEVELPADDPRLNESLGVVENLVQFGRSKGFDYEEIVITGFSQGAALALEYIARSPAQGGGAGRPFKAVVSLSGALVGTFTNDEADRYVTPLPGQEIYLNGYDGDNNVPIVYVDETEVYMRDTLGATVTRHIEPGARHNISNYDMFVTMAGVLAIPEE